MIKSMTGYGRVETMYGGRNVVVEAKSVNHRFLEISLKMPSVLFPLEPEYKKKIAERFKRGRIDVSIRLEGEDAELSGINLNIDTARGYFNALMRLKEEFGIQEPVTIRDMISFRDIFAPSADKELDAPFLGQVEKTLQEALSILVGMRQDEGISLFSDMQMRLQGIREMVETMRVRSPQVVMDYQKRLSVRIKDLAAGFELDDARLAQEVAIMAERCDITEELVRMGSHISQFEGLLKSDEAEGRKIDFLLQEMNREINTIGSKCNDLEIARQVIEAKSELGKLREQAQNIE
ncbi:MAG TPA: YicC family protein [Smithellaceae bacterium]|nr:YicC family protein [Syntrophaceae bacterium]HPV49786.1 YicC family protein [Smithellaceae bacterium]